MINQHEPEEDPGPTQQDRVYLRLREDILAGELLPLSKLHISNLRSRYDTSVGPIREALSRLSGEGLVNKRGLRGHWVAPVSLEEVQDVTRLRVMLEADALRESIRRGDLEWEAQIVGAMHRLKSVHGAAWDDKKALARAVEKENREFHMALIARCPSRWQLRFIGTLYDQTARYRRLSVMSEPGQVDPWQKEHREIMEAALARDADRACASLRTHIEAAAASIAAAVFAGERHARERRAAAAS
jgi:GntR family transcriptional regulator, carbon starvation induced regulator